MKIILLDDFEALKGYFQYSFFDFPESSRFLYRLLHTETGSGIGVVDGASVSEKDKIGSRIKQPRSSRCR